MAQKKSIFLLIFAFTPLNNFAMEPLDQSPREKRASEREKQQEEKNRTQIEHANLVVDDMLEKTSVVIQKADDAMQEAKDLLTQAAKLNDDRDIVNDNNNARQSNSPQELPSINTLDQAMDSELSQELEKFFIPQQIDMDILGETNIHESHDAAPVPVHQEEFSFPAQPRHVPIQIIDQQAQPALDQATEPAPKLEQLNPEPALVSAQEAPVEVVPQQQPIPDEMNQEPIWLGDDLEYYLGATAEEPNQVQRVIEPLDDTRGRPFDGTPLDNARDRQDRPFDRAQDRQPSLTQASAPQPAKIDQEQVAAALKNILPVKESMITASVLGLVHYAYENELLNNAVAVRSKKMCEFMHSYLLPTMREALAAYLIQLLIPHLPYLNTKSIRSYSAPNYLTCFVITKILGASALYMASLISTTKQGKKLVTHYKELPKKTKETIEKIIPWLTFARNTYMARSLASNFE